MYCHSNNVFHRDLKPANIVVDKNNICKLIDFGMAIDTDRCTNKVGTIGYIPNEAFQINPNYSCAKADIYALGIIFVYLLTGKHFLQDQIIKMYNTEKNMLKMLMIFGKIMYQVVIILTKIQKKYYMILEM
jgi:serine/threonine protein kinase